MKFRNFKEIERLPQVGVIPTDTVYGVVARISDVEGVERIYKLKQRSTDKPLIVLISSFDQLQDLPLMLDNETLSFLNSHWPSKLSVVLKCESDEFSHIHRGTNSISVRMPAFPELRDFLNTYGPLVAPSANPQGLPPATNIEQAYKYFGDSVDYYIDGGERDSLPSTLVKISNGEIDVLREGAVTITY